jgi:hypothetical protein
VATYYVNAGGSQTSPFDTPAKGANTIKYLIDNVTEADDDIIEIVDNGAITESVGFALNNTLNIRSYGTDGTDRATSKPTINWSGGTPFGLTMNTAGKSLSFSNLEINASCSSHWFYSGAGISLFEAQGCIFRRTGGNETTLYLNDCVASNIFSNIFPDPKQEAIRYSNPAALTLQTHNVSNNIFYGSSATSLNRYISSSWVNTSVASGSTMNVTNNIFDGGVDTVKYAFSFNGTQLNDNGVTIVCDYNLIYNTTESNHYDGQLVNEGFVNAIGPNDVDTDPLFTNAGTDFTLTDDSPAINSGTTSNALIDFIGVSRPVGAGFDMGAYDRIGFEIPLTGVQILYMIPNNISPDKLVSESDNGEFFGIQKNTTSARVEMTTLSLKVRQSNMEDLITFLKTNYRKKTVKFDKVGMTPFLNADESNECRIISYTSPVKEQEKYYTMSLTLRKV